MSAPTLDDPIGAEQAPARYIQQERETIDRIRDELGDAGFIAFCRGNVIKYLDRKGAKGDPNGDAKKAQWYDAMARHVEGNGLDPRSTRPEFIPYQRPSIK